MPIISEQVSSLEILSEIAYFFSITFKMEL